MARLKRERREWMASSSSSWCRPQFWHLYKRLKLKQSPSNVLKHEQQQQQLFFRSSAYTATSPESIDSGRSAAAAAGIQYKIAFCTSAKLYCAKTFEQRTPNAGLFHCAFLVSSQSVSPSNWLWFLLHHRQHHCFRQDRDKMNPIREREKCDSALSIFAQRNDRETFNEFAAGTHGHVFTAVLAI